MSQDAPQPPDETACPSCGERILAAAKKCKHCGDWISSQPNPILAQQANYSVPLIEKMKETSRNNEESEAAARDNFFLSGGFGLAKTFWLYWFIPSAILGALGLADPSDLPVVFRHNALFKINLIGAVLDAVLFAAVRNTTASRLWKSIALIVIGSSFLLEVLSILI